MQYCTRIDKWLNAAHSLMKTSSSTLLNISIYSKTQYSWIIALNQIFMAKLTSLLNVTILELSLSLKVCKFLCTFFCWWDPKWLLLIVIKVASVTRAFTLRYKRCFNLKQVQYNSWTGTFNLGNLGKKVTPVLELFFFNTLPPLHLFSYFMIQILYVLQQINLQDLAFIKCSQ